jgi:hypothetical protein
VTGPIQEALIGFANVMTIPEDHIITVEKQSRSGPVIALFKQTTSFNRGGDTALAFTTPNNGDCRRGRPPDG